MNSIISASDTNFKKSDPSILLPKEPRRPWWNSACETAVKNVKQAEKEWRHSPLSSEKRAAWKKADAVKKRLIIAAKKHAWESFISNLNPQDGQKTTWSFTKAMIGSGHNGISNIPPLKNPGSAHTSSTPEKANIFLDLFGAFTHQDDNPLDPIIASHIAGRLPNNLNNAVIPNELDQALQKIKSKATGFDQIHNIMLTHLSPTNKQNILHLFNSFYANEFVPETWKLAIVIPLLKAGKPADSSSSYRPISLTSCLGKVFERIVTACLTWFVESKSIIGPEQAGFRKNRCTSGHLIKIDHDIKKSFKDKQATVAVFLDINKAYDSVWTRGLLYRLTKIGINGNCLGWLSNFLCERSIAIRLRGHTSNPRKINNGGL
jgi:hypothetical protein